MRRRLAGTLALHLGTGDGGLDAGVHAPTIGGEVSVPIGGDQGESAQLRCVDPVFELAGLAGEPVEVVADDGVERPGLVVGDHLVVGRADLGAVRGALRLVDVGLDDLPLAVRGKRFALLTLAVDCQTVHLAVERDAQVDGRLAGRV